MKIGQLASQSGLSVHTLRYYEKCNLLVPKTRGDNNYRSYSSEDVASARFIKRCKQVGFSLQDTKTLIAIKDAKSEHVCAEAKHIAQSKIEQVQSQIEDLQNMLSTLNSLANICSGGDRSAEFCSIIASLEAPEEE